MTPVYVGTNECFLNDRNVVPSANKTKKNAIIRNTVVLEGCPKYAKMEVKEPVRMSWTQFGSFQCYIFYLWECMMSVNNNKIRNYN